MPHVVECAVDAGVAGAEDFLIRQPGDRITRGVGVAEEHEFDALSAIIEDFRFVKRLVRNFQFALGDVFALSGCGFPFFRALDLKEPGAILVADDLRTLFGPDCVAIGVVAMMVRIENVLDRLIGRLLDRRDDLLGALREIGIDHDDIILEDDPRNIAAPKRHLRIGSADR